MTDRVIEELLEQESRYLPLQQGGTRLVTDIKAFWANYDLILQYGSLSPLEISGLAVFRGAKSNLSFEDGLKLVITDLRDGVEGQVNEARIEYLEERLMSAQTAFRSAFLKASRN